MRFIIFTCFVFRLYLAGHEFNTLPAEMCLHRYQTLALGLAALEAAGSLPSSLYPHVKLFDALAFEIRKNRSC